MNDSTSENKQFVGQGRSAKVYLDHDNSGRPLAQKVFTGESLSKFVLFILTGSANPYTWCEAAMDSAVARRHILTHLVHFWFGKKLRLPRVGNSGWNEQHMAYELKSELIDGRHAPLRSPIDGDEPDYIHDLRHRIMLPLQEYLIHSGFDGLVWQAGLGNPVASNNFMLENTDSERLHWVWIDLESGVPALFAMNPLATINYYLPKSLHHRRWLFDDVDILKLRNYLDDHQDGIIQSLGQGALKDINKNVDDLEHNQNKWKLIQRHQRGITYALSRKQISEQQADWYNTRPIRWFIRQIAMGIARGIDSVPKLITQLWSWMVDFPLKRLMSRFWHYIKSIRYRWGIARWYVRGKLNAWHKRRLLKDEHVSLIQHQLKHDDASAYLADFSVHLGIKPLVKIMVWGIFPALWALGLVSGSFTAVVIVAGGAIGRTIYTTWRMMQAFSQNQSLPWVALVVGVIPVMGNMAYPIQLLFSSLDHNGWLARFIVFDIATSIGRRIPIWGGADTLTEHMFNRSADRLVKWLIRIIKRHPPISA